MIINGFFPTNVHPFQDGRNGEIIGEGAAGGGDFSALLFPILATPLTIAPQLQGDVGPSLVTVCFDSGSSGDLHDAKSQFIDAPLKLTNQGADNLTLAGAGGRLPVTGIAPVETSNAQAVAALTTVEEISGELYPATEIPLKQDQTTVLQSESSSAAFSVDGQVWQAVVTDLLAATPGLDVVATAVKHEGEGSEGALTQIPRNLVWSKNLAAEAISLEGSVIHKPAGIAAAVPNEFSPSSQTAPADNASDGVKSSGNVWQPSIEFRKNSGVTATETQATTPNPDAPWANTHITDQTDPRQGRVIPLGYSTYAKDNPDQAISMTARERVSPDDGGLRIDNQLQTQTGSEPRGRILSETIHGIGKSPSPQPDQREQGAFFQQGDHETYREPVQAPSESARHSDALFHVTRLADDGPSATRVVKAAQWRPIVDQVAGEITGRIQIGNTEAIIQLDPPELGKLRIDLHLQGDRLEARIFAETDESRTLIESHLTELRQALGENRVELVDVRVDSGSWASARGDGHQGPRQETGGGRQSANDFDGTARSAAEEQDPAWRQGAAGERGRVSMWA